MELTQGPVFNENALIEKHLYYDARKINKAGKPKSIYFGKWLYEKDYFINQIEVNDVPSAIPSKELSKKQSSSTAKLPDYAKIIGYISDGTYHHRDCKRHKINVDGKERDIDLIYDRDKVIQGVAADALAAHIDKDLYPGVHGYRPSYSYLTALRDVVRLLQQTGYRYAVRVDIKKFFDNIPLEILKKKIEVPGLPVELQRFLLIAVGTCQRTWSPEKGLPTGWPINPPLANLLLTELDWEIDRLVGEFVRYGDDYYILVASAAEAECVLTEVKNLLGKLGFMAGPKKSKANHLVGDSNSILPFLGHLIRVRAPDAVGNPVSIMPHADAIKKVRAHVEAGFGAYRATKNKNSPKFVQELNYYLQGVSSYYYTYNAGWGLDVDGVARKNLNADIQSWLGEILPTTETAFPGYAPQKLNLGKINPVIAV